MLVQEKLSTEDYNRLVEIQKEYPKLTYNNKGYEYLDKSEFTEEESKAFNEVTELLKKVIGGFHSFNNFKTYQSMPGQIVLRFQYDYAYGNPGSTHFTGVGYLNLLTFKPE
jgi:hypothetical protein